MSFLHFLNCLALCLGPHVFIYRSYGLAEFGTIWTCMKVGCCYLAAQTLKMLALASIMTTDYEQTMMSGAEVNENFAVRFLRATFDVMDVIFIYIALRYVSARGHNKLLVVGAGWATTELLGTRIVPLWIGLRSADFDWQYLANSIESNVDLVSALSLSALVSLWMRCRAESRWFTLVFALIAALVYRHFVFDVLFEYRTTAIVFKLIAALVTGALTMFVHSVLSAASSSAAYERKVD